MKPLHNNRTVMMSEQDQIKTEIAEMEEKIKKAEDAGGSEAYLTRLQAHLTRLQNKEYLLMTADSGSRLRRFRTSAIEEGSFPPNGIGAVLLRRENKVHAFLTILDRDIRNSPRVRISHYFPGPKGNGKSVWLSLLGMALKKRGDVVYHIEHAAALTGLQEELESVGSIENSVYLLIDEVQANLEDSTWGFLLKQNNRGIVVIGAGMPVEDQSPAFLVQHSPLELLLTGDDFDDEVVLKLSNLLEAAPRKETTPVVDQQYESPAAAVRGLVDWLLTYTRGHAYPLLRLAEYCLTEHADLCNRGRYAQIVGGTFFNSEAGQAVAARSYALSSSCRQSAAAIFSNPRAKTAPTISLIRAGLWDEQADWFLSDFLVFYIFSGKTKTVASGALTVQRLIEIGLSDLDETHFRQLCSGEEVGSRYDNSVGNYFGWTIAGIESLYVSPQRIVSLKAGEAGRRGQLPTIDYFVNGQHNTFIELVKDSSKLEEHFDKFELEAAAPGQKSVHTDKYFQCRDNYVILDLVLDKAEPTPIPEKHAAALGKYYSFVKSTNTLYLAGQVLKENVSSRLPQYPRARPFCTARRGFEDGGVGNSSSRAVPSAATVWLLRECGGNTSTPAAATALLAKPPVLRNVHAAVAAARDTRDAELIRRTRFNGPGAGQRELPPLSKARAGRGLGFLLRVSKLVC